MKEYRLLERLNKYLLSKKSEIQEGGSDFIVGAVAVSETNKIISFGTNSFVKTHPTQKKFAEIAGMKHKEYLHAEISALIKAKAKAHTLIVSRLLQGNDKMALSRPCPVCQAAIKEAGLKKVFFTNDSGELVLMKI